ncbi:MAG: hypothetical protein M0R49_09335 [Limnochordia bacterium]|nr:hypothetical protein [Limnochordia bacterium]
MQQYKRIIYLDQNFLSNLAKTIHLSSWEDPLEASYRTLYDILSDLTECNKIICPTSYFHREESEMGYRVRDFLWHFAERLGYGLSFKHSADIRKSQLIAAAKAYCGLPDTENKKLTTVFNRDPHIQVEQLSSPALLINIPNSQEFTEYLRLSKSSFTDEYWEYKVYCRGKRQTYANEYDIQRKQLVLEIFIPRLELNIHESKLEYLLERLGASSVNEFNNDICNILQNSANPSGFFTSTELLSSNYIHIFASLIAADIFFYPNTKPSKSG